MLRDRYAAAPVWLCVYIFQERHQREKAFRRRKKKLDGAVCHSGTRQKRKVLCDVKIFWNEHHPIFFFFLFQIITSVLDWTSTKVKLVFFGGDVFVHTRDKNVFPKEKKRIKLGIIAHREREREKKKKISFLRVLSVDTQSVASTTSSIRRLGKASQRYKSTSSSFP